MASKGRLPTGRFGLTPIASVNGVVWWKAVVPVEGSLSYSSLMSVVLSVNCAYLVSKSDIALCKRRR